LRKFFSVRKNVRACGGKLKTSSVDVHGDVTQPIRASIRYRFVDVAPCVANRIVVVIALACVRDF
jgi:hypothetical protein